MLRPTHRGAGDPEAVEQLLDVGRVLAHRHPVRRDRAAAEAAQVGRDDPEAVGQRRQLRRPQRAVERVAVDQHHAVAAAGIVEGKFHPASLTAGLVRSQRLFGRR